MGMVKYFSFKEFEKLGYIRPNGWCFVLGKRDIGKTYGSVYELLDDGRINKENWIAIVRNSDEEIKKFKTTFNERYKGKYKIEADFIYEIYQTEWINKKTQEIEIRYVKGNCIGICVDLSPRGIDSTRSGDFSKVKFIICDEFNLCGKGKGLSFDKFQAFYKTIVRRRTDVKTLFIGNRDDAASDMIVNLSIDIEPPCGWKKHKGHWIHYFTGEENPQNVYINLDDRLYDGEHTKKDNWILIMQNSTKAQYVNNRFLNYENTDCRFLTNDELDEVSWTHKIEYDTSSIFIGKYEHILIIHLDKNKSLKPLNLEIYSNTFENNDQFKININLHGKDLYELFKEYFTDANKPYRLFTSIECKETFMKIFQRCYMDYLANDQSFRME